MPLLVASVSSHELPHVGEHPLVLGEEPQAVAERGLGHEDEEEGEEIAVFVIAARLHGRESCGEARRPRRRPLSVTRHHRQQRLRLRRVSLLVVVQPLREAPRRPRQR